MYVRWMLVALVGVLSTTLVMWGEAASPDVAFPLYKLQDVLGRAVTTPQGKEVGHIENVILDAATGDLLYCVVTSGVCTRRGRHIADAALGGGPGRSGPEVVPSTNGGGAVPAGAPF